jgi:hypothetical protein
MLIALKVSATSTVAHMSELFQLCCNAMVRLDVDQLHDMFNMRGELLDRPRTGIVVQPGNGTNMKRNAELHARVQDEIDFRMANVAEQDRTLYRMEQPTEEEWYREWEAYT